MNIAAMFEKHNELFEKYSTKAMNPNYGSAERAVFSSMAEAEARIIAALIAKS